MEEQKAYDDQVELYRHPSLLQLWTGSFNVGLGLATGNSNTFNFTTGFNAVRDTHKDKIGLYFASIYGTGKNLPDDSGGSVWHGDNGEFEPWRRHLQPQFEPEAVRLGAGRLSRATSSRSLEFQINPSGGFGCHAIKTRYLLSWIYLVADRSISSTTRPLAGARPKSWSATSIDKVWHKRTHLHQSLRFFPNMSDLGQYRVNFDLVASTAVSKLLTLNVTFSDRFTSNPPPGTKDNDLILSAGVGLTFTKLK